MNFSCSVMFHWGKLRRNKPTNMTLPRKAQELKAHKNRKVGWKSTWRLFKSLIDSVPHIARRPSLLYSGRRAQFLETNGKMGIIREIIKVSQNWSACIFLTKRCDRIPDAVNKQKPTPMHVMRFHENEDE